MSEQKSLEDFQVIKLDEDQRILYGWASVSTYKGKPVVDLQGDIIDMETLEKAANSFMESVRVGMTMHDVSKVTGQVIHSMPVTQKLCEALGIQSDTEGWMVGYKVYDDEVWEAVKSGEYRAFSIGGRANRVEQE